MRAKFGWRTEISHHLLVAVPFVFSYKIFHSFIYFVLPLFNECSIAESVTVAGARVKSCAADDLRNETLKQLHEIVLNSSTIETAVPPRHTQLLAPHP
ncbi:MAG: hypothetical protein WBE38_14730, partial [Terracidiphilus sp.]